MTTQLIEDLKKLEKPVLTDEKKAAIKESVFLKLESPVVDLIKSHSRDLRIDRSIKAKIKERIFELIEKQNQRRFFIRGIWVFHKRLASAFVLMFMLFSMFGFLAIDTNVVMAQTFTTLDGLDGEVFVKRGEEFLEVESGMRIFEDDVISTGEDGLVSIKFFDDSISRLASETEIVVDKLFKPHEYSVTSHVEFSLIDGEVWNRVVNLVEKDSSFVVQALNVYATAKKAAFNVRVNEEEVEVEVFNSTVDLQTEEKVEKMRSGQRAIVTNEQEVEIKDINELEKAEDWIVENLNDDKIYLSEVEERLVAAKMESIGFEEGEEIDFETSFKDEALVFLTFDDIKKQQKMLDLAEKEFMAAELKLNDTELTEEEVLEVMESLNYFAEAVNEFYLLIEEVEATDLEYAQELRVYVEDKVYIQKKNLSMIKPDAPSYEAKEIVDSLELLGAKEDGDLIGLKMDQAENKLSEIEDAMVSGDSELAERVVEEYKKDMEEVATLIESAEEGVKEQLEDADVDQVSENLKRAGVDMPEDEEVVVEISEVVDEEVTVYEKIKDKKEDKLLPPLLQ